MRHHAIWICLLVGCGSSGNTLLDGMLASADLATQDGATSTDGPSIDLGPGTPLCNTIPSSMAASQARAQKCALGEDAALFLRSTPYTKVVVEVAATTGATPSSEAIAHLTSVIEDVCDKPGGVSVVMGAMSIPSPGHALSIDDVRALEDANRTQFALGDTAVFFYLVVADPSTSDSGSLKTLGIAYRPTSMVVYQGSIKAVSGGLGQPTAATVESAVVAHEYGHILGLVNITDPMVTPHQDTAHGSHCSNTSCLMYYLNNSSAGLTGNLLTGGNIADFDAQCRADLMAVRNGS